jgi:tetratricopeptide (TPR) repeat protein
VRLGRSSDCVLPVIAIIALATMLSAQTQRKANRSEAVRLNNIGVALMNQQEMEKSIAKFDAALSADPALSTAELNKGIAMLNLQKLPEAEVALKRAAAADPNNPRVWFNLGLLHRNQAANQAAVEDLERVVKLDPSDADSHYLLGTLFQQMQQNDRAMAEFETALKLNPLHASAEFGLARTLQRIGKTEEARVHLKRFEHLTREKISSAMTLGYGEQGRYSSAEPIITNEPSVGPMIPITFASSEIGSASGQLASGHGGGICVIDLNGDSRPDLVVLGSNPAIQVFINEGKGQFKQAPAETFGLALKRRAISCAVGDYDNDKLPDLVVGLEDGLVLFRNEGGGKFSDVTKSAGLSALNKPAGITFLDFDHDGDLDLFVTGSKLTASSAGPNILWRNNGNGTFTEWTPETGLAGEGETVGAVLSDLNNDRAIDLVVTGSEPSPTFYANPREGKFQASPIYDASLPPTVGVTVLDFNKDGWMDIALTHAGAPGITLWKNIDGNKFERVALPLETKRGWGVAALDVDNDGWIDLAAVVETSSGPEVHVLRNLGERGFADVTNDLGLNKVRFRNARSVVTSDIDGDGDADLVVTQADGSTMVLRNDGGNRNHSLRLSFAGLADNRSALGTKIEVYADGLWQKWEIAGGSGYLSQGSNEIIAGLGSRTNADIVRMLWPTGVFQDELDIAADKPVSFAEIDRRGSSCPTLFAWNGEKYEFISDVLGAAVVGHWVSPTEKNVADPDEWVKIEGSQLRAKNGRFSLRFGEPMEEVNFLDQVRLVAIDHPAGTEVYSNERFLSAPPFPETRTVVSTAPHAPAGAWDNNGNDVLELLRRRDHRYVKDFTNIKFAGYANMHSLTLDIGQWNPSSPLRMFMHGFIEYFTATSMYAAWQAGIDPVAPYVEAQMPDGAWKRIVDDMGFPAGLPRTIVVDLSGKLPPGTRKIRITTNLQIYWDQILVDNGSGRAPIRTTELPLESASLAFRGYPQQIEGETPGDLTYDYSKVSLTGPFSRERGTYTRYGDVTELLKKVDDHYVIFGSGEDMDLEFPATALPPVPKGWKRDYFFYANGFVKDMDFYEASPFTVAQFPFHGMKTYPYSEEQHYPDDPASLSYFLEWNNRFEDRMGATKYRFHYRTRKAPSQ